MLPLSAISETAQTNEVVAAAEVAEIAEIAEVEQPSFAAEGIRRAEAAGFRPAQCQRQVDWASVCYWEEQARRSDFEWQAAPTADRTSDGAIIVGPTADGSGIAIHSGQHRILGGLLANRPVPRHLMTWLSVPDRSRGWNEAQAECDFFAMLAL